MKFARILYNDEIYYAKYDSSSNMLIEMKLKFFRRANPQK